MKEIGEQRELAREQIWHLEAQPIVQAQAIARLMKDRKLTQQEIADLLSWSQSRVRDRLKLLNLIPQLMDQLVHKKLGASTALRLADLAPHEQRGFLGNGPISYVTVLDYRRGKIMSQDVLSLINQPLDLDPEKLKQCCPDCKTTTLSHKEGCRIHRLPNNFETRQVFVSVCEEVDR